MNDDARARDPRTERRRDPTGAQTEAWKQTLEDMDAIARQRRDDGWDVLTVRAAQTDTVSRDTGDPDRFGLVHVVPDNDADEFAETYDEDAFTEYLAYGASIGGYVYLVTELIDPSTERSILIAGRYDLALARGLITAAREEGVLYTHCKTIDGTNLGSFEHEEYEPLLPDA